MGFKFNLNTIVKITDGEHKGKIGIITEQCHRYKIEDPYRYGVKLNDRSVIFEEETITIDGINSFEEWMTEASFIKPNLPKPIEFERKTIEFNRHWFKIAKYKGVISLRGKKLIYDLMNNGAILQIEDIAIGSDIYESTRIDLQERYPIEDEWIKGKKEKGIGWINHKKWFEIHWYEHKDLIPEEKLSGAVDIKIKWEDGILIPNYDLRDYLIEAEGLFMERTDRSEIQKAKPPEGYIPLTKENILTRYKPLPDGKVVTKSGYEIRSKPVLAIIKELKQCMEKNDLNEFCRVLKKSHDRSIITHQEYLSFSDAIIADQETTVHDFIFDLDDLKNP